MRKGSHHSAKSRKLVSEGLRKAHAEGRIQPYFKGKELPPEVREKISINRQGRPAWNRGLLASPEERLRLSSLRKGLSPHNKGKPFKHSGSFRKGHPDISNNKGRTRTTEQRCRIANAVKKMWKDPEYVLKVIRNANAKPNKPEMMLEMFLTKNFPQFKYNGDGRLGIVLAGLVPDFVNMNGKKEIIELYGDYWHNRHNQKWYQTELGRIMAYNSVGFKCLVVWEHELKDEKEVITKIRNFIRKGKG